MPVPSAEVLGGDFAIHFGGTAIAGRRGGNLVMGRDVIDTTDGDSNKWREVDVLQRFWRVPYQGIYVDGTTKLKGCGTLKLVADGGTLSTANIEYIKEITLSLSLESKPKQNCSSADDRELQPSKRSATLTVRADWKDPENASTKQQAIYDDWASAAPKVDWQFDLGTAGTGGSSYPKFVGEGYVTDIQVLPPIEDNAELVATVDVTGSIAFTDSTATTDAPLLALIRAIIPSTPTDDPTTVAVDFRYNSASATKWTGSAYVSRLDITFRFNAETSVSAEMEGTGALTRETVAP